MQGKFPFAIWGTRTLHNAPTYFGVQYYLDTALRDFKGLFTPWTMKSSQGPVKFVIGCWIRPGTTSVYTKEKMWEWPRSLRPPKDIFEGLHHPLIWSNGFCGGRLKRGALVEKRKGPWEKNVVIINFQWNYFCEKEDEDKRMVKLDFEMISSKLLFLGIY